METRLASTPAKGVEYRQNSTHICCLNQAMFGVESELVFNTKLSVLPAKPSLEQTNCIVRIS